MGCATAWRLAEAGAQVTVLERAVPGAEASSAAAGILGAQIESSGPGPLLELCLASRALWPQFAAQLQQASGVDVRFLRHGLLEICTTPAEVTAARARAQWQTAVGLRAQWLPRAQALAHVPVLGPAVLGALHVVDDAQVEPRLLVRALAIAAQRAGAHFLAGHTVTRVEAASAQVAAVVTDRSRLPTDAVVVAAGAWTDCVAGLPQLRTAVVPQHGQLLMLQLPRPLFALTLAGQRGYVVPRADGRVVVGATSEALGYEKQVTAHGTARLLELARSFVPALAAAPVVETWSGLRPRPQDGLPLLGPHSGLPGLVLASGHHRNGILLTPVTAEVAARAVLGKTQPLDITPFAPNPARAAPTCRTES